MQYCPSCQIHIAGNKCCCPLCGGALEGKGDPQSEIFPRLTPTRSMARRVLRILALTGAAATAVCVLINLAMGTAVWWSLFVAGGVACGILTVAIGIAYRRDIHHIVGRGHRLAGLVAGFRVSLRVRHGPCDGDRPVGHPENAGPCGGRAYGRTGACRSGAGGAGPGGTGELRAALAAVHRLFYPVSGGPGAAAQADCLGRASPPVPCVNN